MPATMQAVVKAQAAPGIELREVPIPSPGPGEVLVRVQAASVCGTDLHIFNWDPWAQGRIHPPLIPGHEFAGVVAAVGRGVTTVKEGDQVSAEMHVACGKCMQCRTGQAHICQHVRILGVDADGAFASYAIIPETQHLEALAVDSARVRFAARPAGQRRPHRAGRAHRRANRRRHRLRRHRAVLHCRGQSLRSRQGLRH